MHGEGAQHLIHIGCAHKLANQLNVVAQEYDRLCNMKDQGCKVLITDTSLLLNKIYGKPFAYYEPLIDLVSVIRKDFKFKSVFIERATTFVQYGRVHTEQESLEIDNQIKLLCGPFDAIIEGNDSGIKELYKKAKKWIKEEYENND